MTVERKNVIFYLALNVRVAGEGAGCERWWITAHTEKGPEELRECEINVSRCLCFENCARERRLSTQ